MNSTAVDSYHGTLTDLDARQAQAAFEALFPAGHTPKTDTRTPAQVEAGREMK